MHQGGAPPRSGLYHRLFALFLSRFNHKYEPLVADRKTALFSGLTGRVLEIGAGTGVNLHFLQPGVDWLGIEPNPYMARYVRRESEQHPGGASLQIGTAESLPAADASVDAVISTLVLCSVTDLETALAEIRRVLKPGGRFVFIEHVAAPAGSRTRRRQDWICPLWRRLADGCHPNRETGRIIEAAGFSSVSLDHFRLDLPIAGPHISGYAVR